MAKKKVRSVSSKKVVASPKKTRHSLKKKDFSNIEKQLLNAPNVMHSEKESILSAAEEEIRKHTELLKNLEIREEKDIAKLEHIEAAMQKDIETHPLTEINFHDLGRIFLGAIIGILVYYIFNFGVAVSESFDINKTVWLYIFSFVTGMIFMFTAYFRNAQKHALLFMPVRLIVIYICSILICILLLLVLHPGFGNDPITSFKIISGYLLLALIGAITGDMVGKQNI